MTKARVCGPKIPVGGTIRALEVEIVRPNVDTGVEEPVNLTGITGVRLQGHAEHDLAPEIDQAGTVLAPATAGVVSFAQAGTFVSLATLDLLRLDEVAYRLQVKLEQGAAVDWTEEFTFAWTRPPLEFSNPP